MNFTRKNKRILKDKNDCLIGYSVWLFWSRMQLNYQEVFEPGTFTAIADNNFVNIVLNLFKQKYRFQTAEFYYYDRFIINRYIPIYVH